MKFFDIIYFDNSVKNYCIVIGIILLVFILKKYVSRYIAAVLFYLTRKFWKNINKKNFVCLLIKPIARFLLIIIAISAISTLNFPSEWQYKIYSYTLQEILNRIGLGIIIAAFTWLVLKIIDFTAMILEQKALSLESQSDDQLVVFFRDFLKVLIVIAGSLFFIKVCFNQPIGNLLTSLSIVGAVIALAARESLENLIASFIIFFDKPFSTGDILKVNAITGTVEKIGLRSTRIRTADRTLVTVPNKQMVDSIVDNWSMRTSRRAEVILALDSKTTADKIEQCIAEIKGILQIQICTSSTVYITEINKNEITITIEYFTEPITINEFNQTKEKIIFSIKRLLEISKIEMAPAVNAITIINNPKEKQ